MPVQILFAGKAHPADLPGQELIQQIVRMSGEEGFAGRVFFLEDYDMRIGGMMVQGADVWLNTPRMPMEASGTSGQKASLNGALNVSILDGWWPEGWDGTNGWAIGSAQPQPGDDEAQDVADAAALYALLEDEVVPEFHDRPPVPGNGNGNGREPLPTRWIARVKDAIATVTPRFSSDRMVRDYVERAYMPLTRR